MSDQTRQTSHVTRRRRTEPGDHQPTQQVGVELDLDALLDDIDRLLAEEDEFLIRFRQRGGE